MPRGPRIIQTDRGVIADPDALVDGAAVGGYLMNVTGYGGGLSVRRRAMVDRIAIAAAPTYTYEAALTAPMAGTVVEMPTCKSGTGDTVTGSPVVLNYNGPGKNEDLISMSGFVTGVVISGLAGTTFTALDPLTRLPVLATATANGVTCATISSDVPWAYRDSDMAPTQASAGSQYVAALNPYLDSSTPKRQVSGGGTYSIEFDFDGQAFALRHTRNNGNAGGRVWVNETLAADFPVVGSGTGYLKVDFGSKALRRVFVEIDQQIILRSIIRMPTDTMWRPEPGGNGKLAVVGDSFSIGTGIVSSVVGNHHGAYTYTLARALGFVHARNYGVGSTGVLADPTARGNYRKRISDVIGYAPDYVFVQGSINDSSAALSAAQIQAELQAYIDALRAALPSVTVGVGGLFPLKTPAASEIEVNNGMLAACAARGVPFIDFITNSNERLGYGSGQVGATTGDGNADIYNSAVAAFHPTQAGHDLRARAIAARLAGAWNIGI